MPYFRVTLRTSRGPNGRPKLETKQMSKFEQIIFAKYVCLPNGVQHTGRRMNTVDSTGSMELWILIRTNQLVIDL